MDIDRIEDLTNLNIYFKNRKMNFNTEQEKFWSKEFGNNYLERNKIENILIKLI